MATPAAVLSIIVEAQNKTLPVLKKVENDLKKVDREKAEATLGFDVDQSGYTVHSALMKKVAASRANGKAGLDVNEGDFAKAHAMVSALDARDVDVDVDINRGTLERIKAVSTALTGLGGAAGGAGGDVGGLGLKLGGLGGSLGSMAPVAIAAGVAIGALGAAIAALTASLGAAIAGLGALATGAMGVMTVGFGGIAAIAAPAISSLTELMGAQEAANKAQTTGAAGAAATAASSAQAVKAAHEQVADATRGVTAAEEQLANTQRSVKIAQESLTQARFDATRQLQDMRRAALESDTSEARARISLQQAQASLREMMREGTASALDIRSAELSVTEARENLRDVTISGNRAQTDYTKAQKGGISQMPGVVSAQQSLQDALRSVKSAQVGVADAHRGVSRALDNLANQQRQANTAMGAGATQMAALELAAKKAGPAAVKFSHHLKALGRHWKDLTKGGQADFFGMLGDGLDRLRNKLPMLAKSANRSMGALRRGFDAFLDRATGPEFNKFVHVMTRTFAKSIGPFSKAFGNIAKVLQRIAVAVAPFVIDMAKAFERITKGWLRGTKDGKKLRETIGGLLDHLGAWLELGAEIGKVFLNLFKALAGDGKGLVEWMTKGAEALNKWLTSKEGREEIKQFMEDVLPLVKELAKFSFLLLVIFLRLFQGAAKLLTPVFKVINWIAGAIAKLDNEPLIDLSKVFKWIGNAAHNTWQAIKAVWEWLENLGTGIDLLKDKWGKLGHILGAPFRFAWGVIKDIFGFIRDKVGAVIDYIKDKWPYIKQVLFGPFRAIGGFVKDKLDFVIDKLGGVKDWIEDKWGKLGDILKKPFKSIAGWVSGVFDKIKDTIIGVVNDLISAFNKLPGPDIGLIGEDTAPGKTTTDKKGIRHFTIGGPAEGHLGGLVTASGIVPLGFQHGGVVGKKGLKPGSKDTVPAMLEVGELVIPKKMVDATKKNAKLTANAMTGELGKGHKEASKDTEKFVKRHGKEWDKLRTDTSKTTTRFRKGTIDDFQKTSKEGDQATSKMRERVSEGFSKMRGNAMESSGKMKSGVGEDFRDLTGAVRDGLQRIGQMTNSALRALGVKKVNFSIGVKGKQRGGLIPGTGDGDKVPVMAEPGEGFINKKAVQAMGGGKAIDRINKAVPRFQRGGTVGPFQNRADVMGSGPGFIPYMNYLNSMFGPLNVISGLRPGSITTTGNLSNHAWGGAVDISTPGGEGATQSNPMTGAMGSRMDAAHAWIKKYFAPMNLDLLWRTLVGGNHYNHIHSGIDRAFSFNADKMSEFISRLPKGGGFAKLKRVLLKGPEGPMKDIGQASLDKVLGGANRFLREKQNTAGFGTGRAPNVKGMWSVSQLEDLWRATGTNGDPNLMARIGFAESAGGDPKAVSYAGARGLWQIMPYTWSDFGKGSFDRAFIPQANATAAHKILASQGLGAWDVWNFGMVRQKGGMVPKIPYVGSFDKGGTVAKDGLGMLHKGEHVEPPHGHGRRHNRALRELADEMERATKRRAFVREEKPEHWKRKEKRAEHHIDQIRAEMKEQRLLIAELKELRKDIREHNRLWRSVKGANKEAVHSVVDLVANGIGAKGLQKTRLAGWGVDRRY